MKSVVLVLVILGVYSASTSAAAVSTCAREFDVASSFMENTCVSPCCLCELVMKAVIGADTRTSPYHLNNRNAAVNRYWLGQPRPETVTAKNSCYDPCRVCYAGLPVSPQRPAGSRKPFVIGPEPIPAEPPSEPPEETSKSD